MFFSNIINSIYYSRNDSNREFEYLMKFYHNLIAMICHRMPSLAIYLLLLLENTQHSAKWWHDLIRIFNKIWVTTKPLTIYLSMSYSHCLKFVHHLNKMLFDNIFDLLSTLQKWILILNFFRIIRISNSFIYAILYHTFYWLTMYWVWK